MNENEFQSAKKQCSRCWEWKPRSAYNKRTATSDGLQPHCRACDEKWRKMTPNVRAEQRKRNAALRQEVRASRVPDWSVCGPLYPRDEHNLLVPCDRLDERQRAQVRELNILRKRAGVFLLPVPSD